MPIYEYQCHECGHIFEEWVNISNASNEAPCPQCGQQAMHIISNTAFVLKGGGWYVTDYGARKSDGHKEGQESGSSNSAAEPAAASAASTASTAAESAPASAASTAAEPPAPTAAATTPPVASA